MSAIAGIRYWDGRPVPESDRETLSIQNHLLGPDGGGAITAPGLAMQAYILRFDSLSANERQPYVFGKGSVLTWDGRLDNRDDLLLVLRRGLTSDITDAAIVAAAYERWGLDSLGRLIGDWSLAIWDAPDDRVVLACDYMGNRPLFYVERPDGILAWSTSLEPLAERFDLFGQPDDEYIAGRLTFGPPPGVTAFRGARKLLAGHCLVAKREAPVKVAPHWTLEPTTVRYPHQRDYDDRLRELLTDAVRCRLRADRTVWAHLSGGWDSSSIVCLSHSLIGRSSVQAPSIQPVSRVASGSPEADESEFIAAVEEWCGVSTAIFEPNDDALKFEDLMGRKVPLPFATARSMDALVHAAGDRVVLSGEIGDLTMFKSLNALALVELLREGRAVRFITECIALATHNERSLLSTLTPFVSAYLPSRFRDRRTRKRKMLARAERSGVGTGESARTYGLTPSLAARTQPHLFSVDHLGGQFPREKREMVRSLYLAAYRGVVSSSYFAPDVRTTYPYVHRPLVEFVLGVPRLTFWEPRSIRSGMRRALNGVLPPAILDRRCKGYAGSATTRGIRPLAAQLAGSEMNWRLVTMGYVDGMALRHAIQSVMGCSSGSSSFVTACIHMEAWLRTISVTRARYTAVAGGAWL